MLCSPLHEAMHMRLVLSSGHNAMWVGGRRGPEEQRCVEYQTCGLISRNICGCVTLPTCSMRCASHHSVTFHMYSCIRYIVSENGGDLAGCDVIKIHTRL